MDPKHAAAAIIAKLDGVLRPLGFRRNGRVYSRAVSDVVHLVELQASRRNTKMEAAFTVNFAVWVPVLVPEDVRDVRKPSVADAPWRERIGLLGPEAMDLWWTISNAESAELVAAEIARRIEQFGLPALNGVASTRDLLGLWKAGKSPGITPRCAERLMAELEASI